MDRVFDYHGQIHLDLPKKIVRQVERNNAQIIVPKPVQPPARQNPSSECCPKPMNRHILGPFPGVTLESIHISIRFLLLFINFHIIHTHHSIVPGGRIVSEAKHGFVGFISTIHLTDQMILWQQFEGLRKGIVKSKAQGAWSNKITNTNTISRKSKPIKFKNITFKNKPDRPIAWIIANQPEKKNIPIFPETQHTNKIQAPDISILLVKRASESIHPLSRLLHPILSHAPNHYLEAIVHRKRQASP
ncbi:actin depolymerizing factor 1 [Striga asiatica]|uniref:Actin depolymerizing factor 1 n=1 Tax=Striga asiatica TaxID=4170 RepID=A0A5A7QND5_STRAF|nr:actin depolymerizing factor 1 [Striga asiatica]